MTNPAPTTIFYPRIFSQVGRAHAFRARQLGLKRMNGSEEIS